MTRAAWLAGLGLALLLADRLARPWQSHVSFVAGMAGTSPAIAMLVIALRMLAALAPILLLAALAEAILQLRGRRRRAACKIDEE